MQLAIISDLHLGANDRADVFGHRDDDFLAFLDFLEANFEQIVLLGDVYETLHGPLPINPGRRLRRAQRAHPRLAARFESEQYVYIHGNHDRVALRREKAPEAWLLERNGTRVLFTHGHHHDRLIRHARPAAELGSWLGGWALRLGLGPLARRVTAIEERLRASEDPESCGFQAWATELARERGADIVVTGHTHMPARHTHDDVVYLNSGRCCRGNFNFATLDTSDGSHALHEEWPR